MTDPRVEKLAKGLVRYSTELKAGEKVFIEMYGPDKAMLTALIREVYSVGAIPFVRLYDDSVRRELLMGATEEQLKLQADLDARLMSQMDAYIGIRGGENASELSDVPADKLDLNARLYAHPVHSLIRVPKTRWVVLRYPWPSMAQLANMSTEAFEDFYFKVCNLDYAAMSEAMDKLVARMERTDKVRLTGKGTDITFSIKGIPAIKCDGKYNIPDGEVFTAPVKDSVNGVITFNTPSVYQGFTYTDISLTFENGRIVKAEANDTGRINKVFDTDEGARFVGEFALGVNPYILDPMKDTLFDEKIMGSLHFTPGACYDEAPNGNDSAIHWDLVLIQTPEYGGGEIWFDDECIRKDGLFVTEDLKCLNPENLA